MKVGREQSQATKKISGAEELVVSLVGTEGEVTDKRVHDRVVEAMKASRNSYRGHPSQKSSHVT